MKKYIHQVAYISPHSWPFPPPSTPLPQPRPAQGFLPISKDIRFGSYIKNWRKMAAWTVEVTVWTHPLKLIFFNSGGFLFLCWIANNTYNRIMISKLYPKPVEVSWKFSVVFSGLWISLDVLGMSCVDTQGPINSSYNAIAVCGHLPVMNCSREQVPPIKLLINSLHSQDKTIFLLIYILHNLIVLIR